MAQGHRWIGILPCHPTPAGIEGIITADNADWLADFTRRLVEDRLATCDHNIAPIRSIYRWEGAVQDEAEARVALHVPRWLAGRRSACELVFLVVAGAGFEPA